MLQPEEILIADSYWIIPNRFMAGEYPSARNELAAKQKIHWLIQKRLDHFIDLTEPGEYGLQTYRGYLSDEEMITGLEISYKNFPIPDMQTPTHKCMLNILDAIDNALNAGKNVYLHCFGGIGRTGTVVGCYLVRHGMEGRRALEQIALWRSDTPDGWRISPETERQQAMVLNWKG